MGPAVPAETWLPAYIGLGSNLGDPQAQLERAFAELGLDPVKEFAEGGINVWLAALKEGDGSAFFKVLAAARADPVRA